MTDQLETAEQQVARELDDLRERGILPKASPTISRITLDRMSPKDQAAFFKAGGRRSAQEPETAKPKLPEGAVRRSTFDAMSQIMRRDFGKSTWADGFVDEVFDDHEHHREIPNGTVRRQTRRVSRWQDGAMVLRWAASSFLNAEKKFRRVSGYRELWTLENALKVLLIANQPAAELTQEDKAA